ncbi:extracellular solute-binding protein [Microbacterium amylolyticum]|uniref:Multiple sugar transport system substrate-binding protein/raffinose/stachyose/melibiose transport system substrate-binding protein n=1 Tax=Microbacterium amylolyticum TaxID=936337 RepID=A0ABS4ZME5_9MICO|nr:extracellular solute-binding protein [Microbacterium amylolyticum]MBP2437626.1 multiple sugar transport system substrate-binding protein/raffinose/stachyose/melibiose transport system substrate-binding protein [Microbacterium amylolyticum]
MHTRRRILATGAAVAAAALVLAGCAGSSEPDDTMQLWHNSTTGPGKQYWDDATAAFAEETGVTINVQSIQNEDMDGRLQTAVNSGDMPDLFMARGGGKLADVVSAGAVKDLSDLIDSDVRADYGDGVFDAFTIDGAIYGLPVAVLPGGIFYSEDLFAAAGIDEEPETIDELLEAAAAIEETGVSPIALGAQDAWPAAHWYYFFALRECSQDVIGDIATSQDFSDPCWLAAGESMQAFADAEPFNRGFLTTSAQQGAGSSAGLLANHQAAMELMGGWNVGVIASLTPDEQPLADLNWFPFPAVDGGQGDPSAMMGGVDGYSCSATSPPACEEFLNFIASTEWQERYAEAYQTIPAAPSAQAAVDEPVLQPLMAAYNDSAYVVVWLDTMLGQNVGNALNTAVIEMLSGNGSPDDLVDTVTAAAARG